MNNSRRMTGTRLFIAALAVAGVGIGERAAQATVNYSDGNFGAPWTVGAQFTLGPDTPIVETAATVPSGGNPGAYYEQRTSFPTANGAGAYRNGVVNAYLFSGATNYAPSASPISSIDFSIDAGLIAGGGVTDAAAVLEQGGNFYAAPLLTAAAAPWVSLATTGLTASSFGLLATDPTGMNPNGLVDFTQNPNFSVTGGLISFGFYSGHSTSINGPGNSITEDFDNWNLTVNNTPEPASVALLLGGSVALLAKRRRRAGV